MKELLRIFVCNNLYAEISLILQSAEYSDVKLINYPTFSKGYLLEHENIAQMVAQDVEIYSKTIFIDTDFIPLKRNPLYRKLKIIKLGHCTSILLNKETIKDFIDKGYYPISNGWLRNVKEKSSLRDQVENLSRSGSKESIHQILFLDTGIPGDYLPDLELFSTYLDKPYTILPIGLSYCKNVLDAEINRWRLETERFNLKAEITRLSKSNADKHFIFNELKRFIEFDDEENIAKELFMLLNVFYIPEQILFHSIENKKEVNTYFFIKDFVDYPLKEDMHFKFEIKHASSLVGIVDIYGIRLPKWKDNYRSFIPIISTICGLSIANVRKYKIIQLQSKKLEETTVQLNDSIHTKDRFFSIIAHDLRSSLAGLMNISETMAEEYNELDKMNQMKLMQALCNTSRNTYHLLDNLLEWSRMERGLTPFEPKKLHLSKILDFVIAQLKESAVKKNLKINCMFSDNLEIYADDYMLQSLLRNLITNAVKFTQSGGKITISATDENNKVLIAVKDTGIGMSPEIKDKLFNLEFRINRNGTQGEPSSGLGLTLCKEFIEKHGGEIWIESEENVGSTIFFTIPDKLNPE